MHLLTGVYLFLVFFYKTQNLLENFINEINVSDCCILEIAMNKLLF